MDFQVVISPIQPAEFVIKNAEDQGHAIRIALDFCWRNYPGFFIPDTNCPNSFPYRGKALTDGYPIFEEIKWN